MPSPLTTHPTIKSFSAYITGIREGMCGVIGMLAVQSGNVPTPRDMRLLSEDVGKAILLAMKGIAAKESAGDGINWKPELIGKSN